MSLRFTDEWCQSYLRKRACQQAGKVSETIKRTKNKIIQTVSPHAQALARLSKKPELAQGNGEHYLQVSVFDYFERFHPEIYDLLHATPNGGYRSKKAGAQMLAEGQKKGYPDISLDAASQGFHGLRIEMKYGKNTLTAEQRIWRERLEKQGYRYKECRSLEEAINEILDYMNLNKG